MACITQPGETELANITTELEKTKCMIQWSYDKSFMEMSRLGPYFLETTRKDYEKCIKESLEMLNYIDRESQRFSQLLSMDSSSVERMREDFLQSTAELFTEAPLTSEDLAEFKFGQSALPLPEFLIPWDKWTQMSLEEFYLFCLKLSTWVYQSDIQLMQDDAIVAQEFYDFSNPKYSHPDFKQVPQYMMAHWKTIPWVKGVQEWERNNGSVIEHRIRVKLPELALDLGTLQAMKTLNNIAVRYLLLMLEERDTETFYISLDEDTYKYILKPLGFLVTYSNGTSQITI